MRREVSICFGLAAITLALYWPMSGHKFISFDDPDYVTENPVVQAGITWPGLRWAFGNHAGNWHPLTWVSHMLDCQVFGLKPGAHHLVSLGLHIASTLLLFLALRRMTGALWRSALVAALFAWHPLHIESVAWVAERKDVLSAFFFMLTLWAYARYAEKAAGGHQLSGISDQSSVASSQNEATRSTLHASRYYVLALFFFALGLMSKPMLVTLPIVLLLLDYWPLRRLSFATLQHSSTPALLSLHPSTTPALRLVFEKLPFFLLALAASIVTFGVQHAAGAVGSMTQFSLGSRVVNVLVSYSAYLGKALWPQKLSVFYPYAPLPAWQGVVSAVLLACLTALCLRQVRARPYLLVGWLWFCVMLLPVIGLVQVGSQAMADRYSYLPLIGLFLSVAWGAGDMAAGSRSWRISFTLGAALLLAACVAGTRFQLRYWQDTVSLFGRALVVTRGNYLAHYSFGAALANQGKTDEAAEHYRAALQISPAYDDAHNNLGCYLAEQGKLDEAKAHFESALHRNPRHALAHRNLGNVLFKEGDIPEAVYQYSLSRQLRPDDVATPEALATVLAQQAESPSALPYLSQALELLPTAELRVQVAGAWAEQGKFQAAVRGYRAALDLQPQSPELLNNLAWILATCPEVGVRDGAEAARLAEHACELTQFKRPLIVGTLAAAYAEAGRFAEAVSTAEKAGALAVESGDEALVGKNQELLHLYRAGQPYREAVNPAPAGPESPKP